MTIEFSLFSFLVGWLSSFFLFSIVSAYYRVKENSYRYICIEKIENKYLIYDRDTKEILCNVLNWTQMEECLSEINPNIDWLIYTHNETDEKVLKEFENGKSDSVQLD